MQQTVETGNAVTKRNSVKGYEKRVLGKREDVECDNRYIVLFTDITIRVAVNEMPRSALWLVLQ
jgi:hypothetical protein